VNRSETADAKPFYEDKAAKNPFYDESKNRNSAANVLMVADDEESIRLMLEIFARRGIHANLANDEKSVSDFFDKNDCSLAFVDVGPGRSENGFKLLQKIKAYLLEIPVVMMAAAQQNPQQIAETAINAVHAGCCEFLIKPLNRQKLETILDTFLPNHKVCNCDLVKQDTLLLYRIVGKSLKLARTVELAKKIAPTSAPVLISGESGTGKELISFLIHYHSKRAHGPYVRVNCAALSDSLLESELFGHEKGAFTGAYTQRKGRFEMAHGGTLLLDEVTETPMKFQAKLLRVLEQQDFERVGGNDNIKIDVRIISTTNKDLLQEVADGRFRQDLYYRLSGVRLIVPPLRQRNEDLSDLVWHFVNLYAPQTGRHVTKLDPAMMNIFAKYHWPGNVRQLRNVVLTSLILGTGTTLALADVSWLFDELQPLPQENKVSISDAKVTVSSLVGMPLSQIEREIILNTLDHNGGNQTKAAKILGISDRTLRDKIRLYRQQGALQLT
jgi:DNA-binding NtrC family response regulator